MNRAKILGKRDSKDDISAKNLTLSQPNLALSASSRLNKLSQVTEAARLNPSIQYKVHLGQPDLPRTSTRDLGLKSDVVPSLLQ
jgi:hypothetical protein